MTTDIIPGCEPFSSPGGSFGVLVLHGLTGNPSTMRPLAERLAREGFTVELPLLPGHGTSLEDCIPTRWSDWTGAALATFDALDRACERVAVVGLSMGGGLTALVAEERPVAACVFINAMVKDPGPEIVDGMRQLLDAGVETFESGNGMDVKKDGVTEISYSAWPLAALQSFFDNVAHVRERLGTITAPCFVVTSREDHTVPTDNSDEIATMVSGPVERVWLEDSYHVATIDNDQELVEAGTVAFLKRAFGR